MIVMSPSSKAIAFQGDRISKAKRSQVMRCVRGKDTLPEKLVRSILHRAGYRFRLHRKDLPGKPDIVLPKYQTVIFVNGCFWHQHTGCKKATVPFNNRQFWEKKLARTVERDAQNNRDLQIMGWCVITVWECELNNSLDLTMNRVFNQLNQVPDLIPRRGGK